MYIKKKYVYLAFSLRKANNLKHIGKRDNKAVHKGNTGKLKYGKGS